MLTQGGGRQANRGVVVGVGPNGAAIVRWYVPVDGAACKEGLYFYAIVETSRSVYVQKCNGAEAYFEFEGFYEVRRGNFPPAKIAHDDSEAPGLPGTRGWREVTKVVRVYCHKPEMLPYLDRRGGISGFNGKKFPNEPYDGEPQTTPGSHYDDGKPPKFVEDFEPNYTWTFSYVAVWNSCGRSGITLIYRSPHPWDPEEGEGWRLAPGVFIPPPPPPPPFSERRGNGPAPPSPSIPGLPGSVGSGPAPSSGIPPGPSAPIPWPPPDWGPLPPGSVRPPIPYTDRRNAPISTPGAAMRVAPGGSLLPAGVHWSAAPSWEPLSPLVPWPVKRSRAPALAGRKGVLMPSRDSGSAATLSGDGVAEIPLKGEERLAQSCCQQPFRARGSSDTEAQAQAGVRGAFPGWPSVHGTDCGC